MLGFQENIDRGSKGEDTDNMQIEEGLTKSETNELENITGKEATYSELTNVSLLVLKTPQCLHFSTVIIQHPFPGFSFIFVVPRNYPKTKQVNNCCQLRTST
jgi:hypothetical protein